VTSSTASSSSSADDATAEVSRRTHLAAAPDPDGAPDPNGTVEVPTGPASVPMVTLLDLDGNRVTHPDYESALSDEQILAAYHDLVMARRLDVEGTNLQRQGQLALWAPCLGQEAAQVGATHGLAADDFIFPSYREHGMALARGLDPMSILRLFRGTDHGAWDTRAHGFGLYTLVVGAQTLHAVGYAMGIQRDRADEAVLVCFGDGATSQGDVNEAFNFAAVNKAPVVFFLQNNQWAISEPNVRQTAVPLYQRAAGFGFPGVRVDGNDVLAVQAVVAAAMDRARSGGGPTLIEAFTFRMGAHTTSDDPKRYRPSADEDYWHARDPLARVETYLRAQGMLDDDVASELTAEADAMAERVRRETLSLPEPEITGFYEHVFAELSPLAAAEQAQMRAYAASFEQD
jgi:2-oxoisovalerate dehydrogenase E1 component alpha subunit